MHLVWRYAYKELQKSLMMGNVKIENYELKQRVYNGIRIGIEISVLSEPFART